jgi:ABC-type glycerol-3-phosphate transport system permease component
VANRSIGGDLFTRLTLVTVSMVMLFPMIFAISNAFKPLDEIFIFPPRYFVRKPTLDNFYDLFTLMANSWIPFTRYIFNSLLITAVGTAGHIIIASMAAFVLAKHKFPGQKLLNSVVILSLMFSSYVTAIPNYLIMTKLGWVNTYAAIIIPAFGYSLGIFLMKQFMEQIPDSTLESARIDGAREITVFSRIVMPSVKPAWLTLMVFCIQILWNNQGGVFIFNEEYKPLPYALQQILAGGIARAGTGAAIALFIMAIPITIFIVSQTNIIQTMATSGMKD